MSAGSSIRVEGLKSVTRAISESDDALEVWLRDGLLQIGENVAGKVRSKYAEKSAVGAAGVKAKVMKRGNVVVAQTLRRSRDLNKRRGAFGGYEMRHSFIPAAEESSMETEASFATLARKLEGIW